MENEARASEGAHTRFLRVILIPSSSEEALNTWFFTLRRYQGAVVVVRDVVQEQW